MEAEVYSINTPREDLVSAVDKVAKEIRAGGPRPNAGLLAFYMSLLQLIDKVDYKRIKEKKHAAKSN